MGVKFTIKGADFSSLAVSYSPKIPNGLQYLNYFGGDKKTLTRNLAPGRPAGIVVGNPVFDGVSASFSYLKDYVKSGVIQSPNSTLLAVFKVPTSAEIVWRHIISNFGGSVGTGLKYGLSMALKLDSPDCRVTLGLVENSSGVATTAGNVRPITLGSYVCMAVTTNSAGRAVAITNLTANSKTSGTYASNFSPELNGELLIGSAAGLRVDSANGAINICHASIYNRELSDAELRTLYDDLKLFYGLRGVSI